MKKLFTLLVLSITLTTVAQAPQGFNYQAIVRNSAGALITNQIVGFKFSIKQTSASGTTVYSETQYVTPDNLGQVSLVVGTGSPSTTATFSAINWASGTYYLAIELNTGTGFVAMGTTQLLSVPYALYALNSGTSKTLGKPTVYITGNITDEQAAAQLALELGTQTDNVYVVNTTGLTTIDLSAISGLTTLEIQNNENLINVNLSHLSSTYRDLSIVSNPILTALSFPDYTTSGNDFVISDNAALTSLSFPILKNIKNYFIVGGPLLSSFSMPLLSSISLSGQLLFDTGKLTSISFPALTSCTNFQIAGSYLTSVSFPVLTTIENMSIVGIPSLTNIGIPSLVTANNINFRGNALPSTKINSLLRQMLTVAPETGKNIDLSQQTPAARPTGLGITDKQTLINNGNSVTTD